MKKYEHFPDIIQINLRQTDNVKTRKKKKKRARERNKCKMKLYVLRYIAKLWLEIVVGF